MITFLTFKKNTLTDKVQKHFQAQQQHQNSPLPQIHSQLPFRCGGSSQSKPGVEGVTGCWGDVTVPTSLLSQKRGDRCPLQGARGAEESKSRSPSRGPEEERKSRGPSMWQVAVARAEPPSQICHIDQATHIHTTINNTTKTPTDRHSQICHADRKHQSNKQKQRCITVGGYQCSWKAFVNGCCCISFKSCQEGGGKSNMILSKNYLCCKMRS